MGLQDRLKGGFRRIVASRFARDSSVNALGLVAAAVFPIAVTPILSRLYAPEQFGAYGLFIAATSMGSIIGAGKYEVAIVIPKEKLQALETAFAAGLVSLGTFLFLCAIVLAFGTNLEQALGLPSMMTWLAPFAVLIAVQFQVLLNCAIRERLFPRISLARIVSAGCSAVLMVVLGMSGFGAWGLVVGTVAGQLAGLFVLLHATARSFREELPQVARDGVKRQFARFSDYPKYAVGSDFANTVALRLPALVFGAAFSPAAVGYLTMFQRVWTVSSILGSGIGETFRQKAASDYVQDRNFRRIYVATFWLMTAFALCMWAPLAFLGPWLFEFVLGAEWREAGVYAQILATLVCIQFVASPLGWSVYIVERLRYNMVWQWSLLATYAVVFSIGVAIGDERQALAMYAVAGSIMYLLYLVISYNMAKGTHVVERP